jgi:DMSO/TMAO reductase YedYZ molybdopterin-dependent catalytic subunit
MLLAQLTMPRRLVNDVLLALAVALAATGLAGWALPLAAAGWLDALHRLLGVALLLVLLSKLPIARRSLGRRVARPRQRGVLVGVAAALALLSSVGLGLGWTLSLVSFNSLAGYSALSVHVAAGFGLLALVGWHARLRATANHSPSPSRRQLATRLVGLAAGSLVGWQFLARAAPTGVSTGSKPAGSFTGNALPSTIWLLDQVPRLDAHAWRLAVAGRVDAPRSWSLAELAAAVPPAELEAVLDCTGGWWSAQRWRGFSLAELLAAHQPARDAQTVAVTSVTGHRIDLPLDEAGRAMLATHVGDDPLSAEHGFPLRLVVPTRRGYHWVKWVARLEVA